MAVTTLGDEECGNVYLRRMLFELVGDVMDGHVHNFDHTTIVVAGRLRARVTLSDGTLVEEEIAAGEHRLILAGYTHEFTALEPNSYAICVYAHRTPQGTVVQRSIGWKAAYA